MRVLTVIKAIILCAVCFSYYAVANAGTLTVHVKNIEHGEGASMVALHDGEKGYPIKREPVASQSMPADDAGVTVSFENLASGTYAIALYHDENGNNKMDQNFIGIPKEGTGASNDAKGRMGPPKFKDAAVEIGEDDVQIEIHLSY